MRARTISITLCTLVFAISLGSSGSAHAAGKNLFGVSAVPPPTAEQLQRMALGGVRTTRVHLAWSSIEPAPGARNWAAFDAQVANAARAGIRLLPFLYESPPWISPTAQAPPIYSPEARSAWTRFLTDLTARYGTTGSFWTLHPEVPRMPITDWQVWNEVNLRFFWGSRPSPAGYRDLVRLTAAGLRAGDSSAGVILAGLLPFKSVGVQSVAGPRFLQRLFKPRDMRKLVDAVAVHPYGKSPRVVLKGTEEMRVVLDDLGARKVPLWVTEFGWSTGGELWNVSPVRASPEAQARRIAVSYRLMRKSAKRLHLQRALYFSFSDFDEPGIDYWSARMGLFGLDGQPKPAWFAYTRRSGGQP